MTDGRTRPGPYRQVWDLPGAPRLLVAGLIARLGQGVTVVAWVVLIRAVTGSFARAGAIVAATSIATAVAAPVGGRLADRFGAGRILPLYALGHATGQLALLAAVLTGAPFPVTVALAAASGALLPATSPALRAAWTRLTAPLSGHHHVRSAAMAIESALFELVFVAGPLLLSGAMLVAGPLARILGASPAIVGPASALGAAAVVTAAGTTVLAAGSALRAPTGQDRPAFTRGWGPVTVPGVPVLGVCAAGIAFSFGAAPVAIAAFVRARDADPEAVTGMLIAVWSLGSALAGFAYGSRPRIRPLTDQFVVLLAALAVGYLAWAAAPTSGVLGLLLLATGAVIAPAMTVEAGILSRLAPPAMLTEAYTWLTTVNLSVAALGSAIAGALVERPGGVTGTFVLSGIATGVAALVATRLRPLVERNRPLPSSTPSRSSRHDHDHH